MNYASRAWVIKYQCSGFTTSCALLENYGSGKWNQNELKWINYSNFDWYVTIMTETKTCWWWTLPSYCCYCMHSFHVHRITKGATSLSKKNDYILFRNIFQPQQEWCLNGVRRLMLSVFSDTPLTLLRHQKRNLVILGNYWYYKKWGMSWPPLRL